MQSERLLSEIRETNLAYLMLAQRLIREDRAQALYRLGLSEEVADLLAALSPAQVVKIAASNLLMCAFRFTDEVVWGLLTSHSHDRAASGAHAAILMAGRVPQGA